MGNIKKDNSNIKIAKIIKGLNALSHLMENIRYNYFTLEMAYNERDNTDDVEYKQVECCFNNFILTAAILKQHIKSFEKNLENDYIKSKGYTKTVDSLFKNETYQILLGMRNYLQHVFHFKIGFGDISDDTENDDLFIGSFTILKLDELHKNINENIAFMNYFNNYYLLPIMSFASENMFLMETFYQKYDKLIHKHYKSKLDNYDKEKNVDQYAMDMHEIYYENLKSITKKEDFNHIKINFN